MGVHVFMRGCTKITINIYVYVYICEVCMYVGVYMYMYGCMYVFMYVHVNVITRISLLPKILNIVGLEDGDTAIDLKRQESNT